MAIGIFFGNGDFPVEKYDDVLGKLEAAGAGAPDGRLSHVALERDDGKLDVFDTWESQEAFDAFGATLLPILAEQGVEPGTPTVAPIHNVING